jgi:hypothetical protein
MYKNLQVLDKNVHIDLRFNPAPDYAFASGLSRAPLATSEMVVAARHYAIVFPAEGDPVPQALFSIEEGKNLYLDENNRWKASYVPAQVRSYPFALARTQEDENTLALCIDRDAPQFQADQGDPLFTANGEPAALVTGQMDFLKTLHQHLQLARTWGEALVEMELLSDAPVEVAHGGGKTSVRGLRTVDRAKFSELDAETLADWHKRGLLELVYVHLQSLDHLARLLPQSNQASDPYKVIESMQ